MLGAIDFGPLRSGRQSKSRPKTITEIAFETLNCNLVVSPCGDQSFHRGKMFDVRNLCVLEGIHELHGPLILWRPFGFVEKRDSQRGLVFKELGIRLVEHGIDDLDVSSRPCAERVVQHPVSFRQVQQLDAELFVKRRQPHLLFVINHLEPVAISGIGLPPNFHPAAITV